MTRLVTYVRANSDREPWVWKEFTKAGPNLSWWFLIEASRLVYPKVPHVKHWAIAQGAAEGPC